MTTLIVDLTLKSAVYVALLVLLTRLLRGASAATRHRILAAGLFGLLTLPFLGPALPDTLHWTLPAADQSATAVTPILPTSASLSGESLVDPVADVIAPAGRSSRWSLILFGTWLLGVLAGAGRLTLGMLAGRRVVAQARVLGDSDSEEVIGRAARLVGLPAPPPVVISERVRVPCTVGVVRPRVVLPMAARGWSAVRMQSVLTHELAHIHRGDPIVHQLGRLASALHWFNPLVWVLAARIRNEAERACDDLVLGAGISPSTYAHDLLEIARTARDRAAPLTAIPMARPSDFEGRLLAVLEPRLARGVPSRLISTVLVVLAMVLLAPIAAFGSSSQVPGAPFPTFASTATRGDTLVTQALLRRLRDERDVRALAATAWALGERRDSLAVPELMRVATAADPTIRLSAIWALHEIADHRALPLLLEALRDEVAEVRAIAAKAIGQLPLGDVPQQLLDAIDDPDPTVREAALWAVGELS